MIGRAAPGLRAGNTIRYSIRWGCGGVTSRRLAGYQRTSLSARAGGGSVASRIPSYHSGGARVPLLAARVETHVFERVFSEHLTPPWLVSTLLDAGQGC